LIGQIGGPTQAVATLGKYDYVGVGLRLIVLDVSDPTSPYEVGSSAPFSDFVRDIAVSGTVAYVAAGGAGLRVLDVSDPTRPAEIGSLQSRGYAEGVAVSGTTVCLAHGPYGLRVIDVSNPRNPAQVGVAFSRNYAFKVAMDGRYAYVAAAGAGLLIADLANPAQPSEVATLATPGYAYGLAVSGNTAYVAGGWEGLLTVDVTSKGQPRLLGQLQTAGWAFGVTVSGTRAYVAAGQSGLRVVDVSSPAGPTEVSDLAVAGGDAAGVAVAGTIAYVADRNLGLEAVNVSAPASPVQLGSYGPMGFADGITVAGNYAYVAAGSYGLRIIDISDPARPRQVGAYDTQSYAGSVAVAGNYAYVAATSVGDGQGLHVVDIRDPARPIRAGFFSDGFGPYHRMTLAGGIVYVSNESGLDLFDVSNPAAPRKLSYLQIQTGTDIGQNTAVGVAVNGNVAYVAVEQQGLCIVDISNPSAPAVMGKFQWPNATAQDIVVAQGVAFVADQAALTIVDVSNPRAPVWLASYPTSGFEESLALAGDHVFVANGGVGLSVIDVSNPHSPAFAWSYRTRGYAESVFVRDDLVFATDLSGGLLVLGKPGSGAAPLAGSGTSHLIVSQGVVPRVVPPPVRAGATPPPAPRSLGPQAASSCVVTSTADSGAGTLRDCLGRASGGTTITFDPVVFPPSHPTTITPLSLLPDLLQGNVTIDASNAGVVLDGSGMPPSTRGLAIGSSGNIIMGLQIVRFPSDGIILFGPGIKEGNLIGGSRNRGHGPLGEGNLISGNGGNGINISDPRVTNTTIAGNFIGTDITGTAAMGNQGDGIFVYDSTNNRIGGSRPEERNVISGNSFYGIEVIGSGSAGNSISGNYLGVDASGSKELSNRWTAVGLERGANANLVQGNVIVSTSRTCIVINDWGSSYNTIVGNFLGTDASGKVFLGSAVPAINVGGGASFNRIGGTTPADRNVIAEGGISFGRQGGPGNLVIGNFIGTDISGSIALAERGSGIELGDGSNRPFIGGTTVGERNVVSGNPYGGIKVGPAADYTFIGGNYIGTDASGQWALGNSWSSGIEISQGTHIIVQGNLIAHHKGDHAAGITVSGYAGNTLRQNLIYDNQGGGIVLQDVGNNGASPPVITGFSAAGVSGTAGSGCEVEIFSDSDGEGQIFEGSTFADASGAFRFDKGSFLIGPNLTATATDTSGNTSAFSSAVSTVGKTQLSLSLTGGGATVGSTVGIGMVRAGYAVLNVNSGSAPYGTAVFSFKQNGVTVSEAGVPASPPLRAARIFIDYRSAVAAIPGRTSAGTVNIDTGIAVVNYGSATANLTYTLRNTAGTTIATGHGTLAAGAHFATFIDLLNTEAPDFVLPANFQTATQFQFASLEISSDQFVSVLALRMTTNQRGEALFTTTPTADLTKTASTGTIYFPQFADGGGYTTSLVLLNTSNTIETGTLQLRNGNGNPLVVNQVGGTTGSVFTYSIPIGGVVRFQTDGSPATLSTGWAQLTPDTGTSTPIGAGVFGYNPGVFLVTESGIPATVSTMHARIYVDMSGGHDTGLAIANPTNANASVTITAFQSDGVTGIGTSQGPLQLPANGYSAFFADGFIAGLPSGFTGVLDITSSTPFAALTVRSLTNERGDFLLVTLPIADMTQSAPSPIVFPQIADGGGYVTQFILIGAGGASSVTLNYYGEDGKPLPVGK
jgi:parallel beta-helix repeat protein